MAFSKTELFSADLQRFAEYYKALAHPARLAILKYLADTKTCITGDIADELPLSRTTVNQHLKELKDAGLIVGTTEGVKTCYCLNKENFEELKKASETFLNEINVSSNFECEI
jgi:ArsR family transcriptional regulator, arsenate/arsenite/antimonite-responsive transcriptional repressor